MDTFKKRLQYVIDMKNFSQRDLAGRLGVNEARVSEWLSGKISSPRRSTISRLSSILGCDVGWLANGTGEPFPGVVQRARIGAAELGRQGVPIWQALVAEPIPDKQPAGPSRTEMLLMTSRVLESNTVFRPALASNIEAFFQAVVGERAKQGGAHEQTDHDLLLMTSRVLESQTVYRTALVSNILAFYQAVQGEEEMSEMKDEIIALREELREFKKMFADKFPDEQHQKREAQQD